MIHMPCQKYKETIVAFKLEETFKGFFLNSFPVLFSLTPESSHLGYLWVIPLMPAEGASLH